MKIQLCTAQCLFYIIYVISIYLSIYQSIYIQIDIYIYIYISLWADNLKTSFLGNSHISYISYIFLSPLLFDPISFNIMTSNEIWDNRDIIHIQTVWETNAQTLAPKKHLHKRHKCRRKRKTVSQKDVEVQEKNYYESVFIKLNT